MRAEKSSGGPARFRRPAAIPAMNASLSELCRYLRLVWTSLALELTDADQLVLRCRIEDRFGRQAAHAECATIRSTKNSNCRPLIPANPDPWPGGDRAAICGP